MSGQCRYLFVVVFERGIQVGGGGQEGSFTGGWARPAKSRRGSQARRHSSISVARRVSSLCSSLPPESFIRRQAIPCRHHRFQAPRAPTTPGVNSTTPSLFLALGISSWTSNLWLGVVFPVAG